MANNNVTQTYDRGYLKRLTETDEKMCELVAKVYNCDPDDLPIDIDCNVLKDFPRDKQREHLKDSFKDPKPPSKNKSLVKETIEAIVELLFLLDNPESEGKESDGGASASMARVSIDEKSIGSSNDSETTNRNTLTQKYNPGYMAALVKCDQNVCDICAELYKCDENDIPVELDVNELKDLSKEERRKEMEAEFAKHPPPKGTNIDAAIQSIQTLLDDLKAKS